MAARSGGGSQSRQVVRPTVKGGPPRTNVVSPTSTDQLGRKVAYEKDKLPLRSTPAPAPLGNQVALNVGAGGPGTGRVLYGQPELRVQHQRQRQSRWQKATTFSETSALKENEQVASRYYRGK